MPKGIAIETSGRVGSVAVFDGDSVVDVGVVEHGFAHASGLLPMIDTLLHRFGWTPVDLQHVYVSVGPGSFTGLRIGITLAKTIALATGAKLLAVPSVDVLVQNAPATASEVLIVLDAKRDQIFTARYSRVGHELILREPAHLDTLTAALFRAARPVHLLGDGIPFHLKFLPPNDAGVIVTPADAWRARAEALAQLGMTRAPAGEFLSPDALIPTYIRVPEAEEKANLNDAKPTGTRPGLP